MISFLQINVGVGRAAQDLALATAIKIGADIVLISEQNKNNSESNGWYSDSTGRSAISFVSSLPQNKVGPMEKNFRWVEVSGLRVYSCYHTPNCSIAEYADFVSRLEWSIRSSSLPVCVAGDFNAKAKLWGRKIEDARGSIL